MLTPSGVGFYSYMTAMVFGDTSISVDEVTSPRFFIVINSDFGLLTKKINQPNKEKLMKTLRLLNTLFFIALTVSFVACSNDDEASSEYPPETALKPTKWTFIYGYDYEFYDDKDRLIKIERYNNAHELTSTINIEYSYGYITASEKEYVSIQDETSWKCTLNSNGSIEKVIISSSGSFSYSSTYLFTYDENNQLTRIAGVDDKNYDCQITWHDGNIVRVDWAEWPENRYSTFTYTSIPSWRGYCAFFDDTALDIFPSGVLLLPTLANHGYFGVVPRYLPSAEIYEDGYVLYMNYTLGENGYVVQFDDSYSDDKVSIDWE